MAGRLEDCVSYMKNRKVYEKLMKGFLGKYQSLGRVGGSVRLTSLSEEDLRCLEGFFGSSFYGQKSVTVSARRLQEALDGSRFAGVHADELLEAYFGKTPVANKEAERQRTERRAAFFGKMTERYRGSFGGSWMETAMAEKRYGYQILIQQYGAGPEELERKLDTVLRAVNCLPALEGTMKRLAVFGAETTGDPHYFDEGREENRLLEGAIAFFLENSGDSRAALGSQEGGQEALTRVERKNERFFRAGLVKDDISNYTVAWGIHCRKKDGRLHEGIEGYAREGEPVHISLWTMGEIAEAFVDNGDGAGAVRVVENPAVFAALAGNARGEAVVCTNGQPRLTSLMLLDLLSRSGCTLYYAGDFDPEGLKIADNLKRRYRKGMRFWHYEIEDYYKARSEVELPEERLKKLDGIDSEELSGIAEVLKRERRAGYQERLIEAYLKE